MEPLQPVEIEHEGVLLRGFAAVPDGAGSFPAVLVMHNALGLGEQVRESARRLAALGYLAVATDMYGAEADIGSEESAGKAFQALVVDAPERLRARVVAWRDAVAARSDVDAARLAAIGYCFGGQCVLELARSGAEVKAVVSYHGLLGTHAPAAEGAVKGQVVVYCGAQDPYAPIEHVTALRKEMEAAGASYQVTVFGDAAHAFTDKDAATRAARPGIRYHALSDKVSWAGTVALLEAVLKS